MPPVVVPAVVGALLLLRQWGALVAVPSGMRAERCDLRCAAQPETQGLCSKCFKDLAGKAVEAPAATEPAPAAAEPVRAHAPRSAIARLHALL